MIEAITRSVLYVCFSVAAVAMARLFYEVGAKFALETFIMKQLLMSQGIQAP